MNTHKFHARFLSNLPQIILTKEHKHTISAGARANFIQLAVGKFAS